MDLKKITAVLLGFCFLISVAQASVSPYGPKGNRFGVGLYVGDPTGFTFKGYLTQQWAIQGIFAWSFANESFTMIGDAVFDFFDIPVETKKFRLPFYAGVGAKVGLDKGGRNKNRTVGGIRIPVGVAMQFVKYPIEVFFEVAPGMEVAPSTDFDITGGLGARFYF